VRISIPTDDEIVELARKVHEKGVKYDSFCHGWSVTYCPAHVKHSTHTIVSAQTLESWTEERQYDLSSCFEIGTHRSVWYVGCAWNDGDESPPRWYGCDHWQEEQTKEGMDILWLFATINE